MRINFTFRQKEGDCYDLKNKQELTSKKYKVNQFKKNVKMEILIMNIKKANQDFIPTILNGREIINYDNEKKALKASDELTDWMVNFTYERKKQVWSCQDTTTLDRHFLDSVNGLCSVPVEKINNSKNIEEDFLIGKYSSLPYTIVHPLSDESWHSECEIVPLFKDKIASMKIKAHETFLAGLSQEDAIKFKPTLNPLQNIVKSLLEVNGFDSGLAQNDKLLNDLFQECRFLMNSRFLETYFWKLDHLKNRDIGLNDSPNICEFTNNYVFSYNNTEILVLKHKFIIYAYSIGFDINSSFSFKGAKIKDILTPLNHAKKPASLISKGLSGLGLSVIYGSGDLQEFPFEEFLQ